MLMWSPRDLLRFDLGLRPVPSPVGRGSALPALSSRDASAVTASPVAARSAGGPVCGGAHRARRLGGERSAWDAHRRAALADRTAPTPVRPAVTLAPPVSTA